MNSGIPTPNINGVYPCGSCGNALKAKGPAKGGNFPGLRYIHCMLCHWHFTFVSEPGSTPEAGGASTTAVVTAVPKASTTSTICVRMPCTKAAHRSCIHKCCRLCCVMESGCNVKGHNIASLSDAQRQKIQGIRSLPRKSQSSTPTTRLPPPTTGIDDLHPSFATFLQNTLDNHPLSQMRNEEFARAQAEKEAASRELELERLEEAEFQAALTASRADLAVQSSPPYLDERRAGPLTSAVSSPPSRRLLASTTSESGGEARSEAQSSATFISGIPVTKVTAKNRPTITTQMNEDWMREHEDRSKQKPAKRGRGQVDIEMAQKFRVVWWEEACASDKPSIIFPVQECPDWPKWRIIDSPPVLARLGTGTIQFYKFQHSIWIECPPSYPHTVKTDGFLFLRRSGINCVDFEAQLAMAMHRTHHHRYFMPNERKSVKQVLQAKKAQLSYDDSSSEGEVEIIEPAFPHPRQHSTLKRHVQDPVPSSKRPRLTPLLIPEPLIGSSSRKLMTIPCSPELSPFTSSSNVSASSENSFFPFSALSSHSVTPPSTITTPCIPVFPTSEAPLSSGFSPSPKFVDIPSPPSNPPPLFPGKSWPSNMYVVDMVYGFRRMDELKTGKFAQNFDQRFRKVFAQDPPKVNTYHDQVRRWNLAPHTLREELLEAGRTSAGHWTRLSRAVPLKTR